MKRTILLITSVAALSSLNQTHAAFAWAGGDVTLQNYDIRAGIQLLPIPFVGTFGVEAAFERPWNADRTDLSFAATVRDVPVPLTTLNLFGTAGIRFREAGQDPFLEGGFRTSLTDLANAVGLRVSGRLYTNSEFNVGVGVEVRF
jgi:hypothetical protein